MTCLSCLFALGAMAPPLAVANPAIVVTGRGLGPSRGEVGYDVVVIDRARLRQSASGRLEDVLRDVAGLQGFRRSDSRSANATSQSLTLRGLGGNASSRALLVLDGVPQLDPFGGWVSFPAYATDRLASARVTRGGGSGLWGPGALAGTVELDSAGPGEIGAVEGLAAIGSRSAVDARGSLRVGDGGAYLVASGAFARGDGFIPIVAEDRGPVDRAAPYRQASVALRGVIGIGGSTELQASLSTFDDRRERGLPFTANRGRGIDGSLRLVGRGSARWSLLAYGQRRRFASQSAAVNPARTTATLSNDQYAVPSRGWGGRAEVEPRHGALTLRLGGDWRAVSGETRELYQFVAGQPTRRRTAGGRSLTLGLFADATLGDGALIANVAGRVDHWSITGGRLVEQTLAGAPLTNAAYPDRTGWLPTGRAGLSWRASPALTLRAAAYRGWRLPTLNELYRPFRVGADATAANPALAPETSTGADAGATLRLGPGLDADATVYAVRLTGAIANVTLGHGPGVFPGVGFVSAAGSYRQRRNLDAIVSRGVELGLSLNRGHWDARLSYAYIAAQVRASGAAAPLDGRRPAQVARHNASATIGWTGPRDLALSLTARGVSGQYDDDLNQRRLRGAVTLDGHVAVPLGRHVALDLRGENLLGRRVETAIGGDGTVERASPRSLWLGLRIR